MKKLLILLNNFIFSVRWIVIINLGLCSVLGYLVVELFLSFNNLSLIQQINDNQKNPVHSIQNKQSLTKPVLNISALIQTHLFGKSAANSPSSPNTQTAPQTRLGLKLHGIYYSSNPHTSLAMITDPSGKTAHYQINASLPGGAVLHKIHKKHVILLRNGRTETLHFMDNKGALSQNANTVASAKNMQKNSNRTQISPEQLLGRYQRQLQTNPNSLMQLARISPVKKAGNLIGYRIKPGQDANLLTRFQLQSGDILTTVNGIKLDNPINGLTVIQHLANAKQIDLEILRNGQVLSLSFQVEP